MPEYAITFARSARKELEKLSPHLADRIFDKIAALATSPHPPGSLKLQGGNPFWRIRIGDYRVIYEIDERTQTIDISMVRHRRDVYRDL